MSTILIKAFCHEAVLVGQITNAIVSIHDDLLTFFLFCFSFSVVFHSRRLKGASGINAHGDTTPLSINTTAHSLHK